MIYFFNILFIAILGGVWYCALFLINSWLDEDLKMTKRIAVKAVLTAVAVIVMTCAVVGITRQMFSMWEHENAMLLKGLEAECLAKKEAGEELMPVCYGF